MLEDLPTEQQQYNLDAEMNTASSAVAERSISLERCTAQLNCSSMLGDLECVGFTRRNYHR